VKWPETLDIEDEGPGRLNIATRFEYDQNGNRSAIIDPRGFRYEFGYDQGNRMISLKYPVLSGGVQHEEFWGYDRFGRRERSANPILRWSCRAA
jgi:hypothetical protein